MNSSPSSELPVIIIGSGLAGLTVALEVADHRPVVMLAKRDLSESATAWAQGGIVGVIDEADDVEAHVADTLDAGAGLVVEPVARQIAMESAAAIDWLINQGVPFTSDPTGPKGLHLVKEGGHSHRRIAHAADATGKAIHEVLLDKAQAHPNISLLQGYMAVDLVVRKHLAYERQPGYPRLQAGCYGVYALNLNTGRVETMAASAVVLATGGAGKVYRYTSNPETATGDGIAMAWRAGCRVANMEFIQFHPTCLYHSQDRTFLITEALRGEGAK
ncbi:MAG: FAD-dependent oxidoreductase, partial [Burkholderiaceae bacterium]